jgi:hypothetical protein
MSLKRGRSRGITVAVPEVAIPHGTIRCSHEGSGRPIVFVHGININGGLAEVIGELAAPATAAAAA